jgi:Periplasmic binding protein
LFGGVALGGGAAASAATSSSQSYTVMVIGGFTGLQSYSVPEIATAVKGLFRADKGVKVETCDDQNATSAALACEHQAIVDNVAAAVVGFGSAAYNEAPLTQAGIPVVGYAATTNTSPNSFALTGGEYPALGVGLSRAGCRRLGILYIDGGSSLANVIVTSAKWQSVTQAAVAIDAPDIDPAIDKLAEGKVQCIAMSVEPNTVVEAMTAIKQDRLKVKVGMTSALLTSQVLASLGSEANGLISVDAQVEPNEKAPVITEIKKDMQAVNPKSPLTTAAITAWASAKLIQDAAQHIKGSVTAASMLKALNGLRGASTDGAIPPFSSIPLPNPAYARLFNHYGIDYVVKNGVEKPLTKFYDLSAALGIKSS